MRHGRVLLVVVAGLCAGVAAVGASWAASGAGAAQARWVISDLGTLGGQTSHAVAINERGQVVGWSNLKAKDTSGYEISHTVLWQNGKMRDLGNLDPIAINERGQVFGTGDRGGQEHVFVWQNGKLTDLGVLGILPGGTMSYGVAINARRQIAANSGTDAIPSSHAFVWQNRKRTALGALPGYKYSRAVGINGRGEIIGYCYTEVDRNGQPDEWVGFVWANGKMTRLGTLGGAESEPIAINDRGQIVGDSATKQNGYHAFLWQNRKLTDLGTLGGRSSHAVAINERGQVIGWSFLKATDASGDGIRRAFLWQNGKMTDLGDLPGGTQTWPVALNGLGQVVGTSDFEPQDTEPGGLISHAFLWQNGKMTDLGGLPGGGDYGPVAINERGQIVGYAYTNATDEYGLHPYDHAVQWTQKPG